MSRTVSPSPGILQNRAAWRDYRGYFAGLEGALAASILGTVLQSLSALSVIWLIRLVFDRAIPHHDANLLVGLGGALLAIRLLNVGASLGLRALNIRIMETAALRLRTHILEKLYRLPRSYYAGVKADELHTAIVEDTGRVKGMGHALVSRLLPGVVGSVVLVAVLCFLNGWLCALMVTVVPLMLAGNRLLSQGVQRRIRLFHRAFQRFAEGTSFVLRAMDLTRIQACEQRELERQRVELETLRDRESAMAFFCAIHGQVQESIIAVSAILILVVVGFYRPGAGAIAAEGIPYDDLDMRDLRRQFGVVMQTPYLISGSIRENITYGTPDVAEDEIWDACRLALAEDFIAALPRQLDTAVGDGGVLLSGGQRQKILVARALLRKPLLFVLDEPTTHLDPESIAQLLTNLRNLPGSPAIITITHDAQVMGDAAERFEMTGGCLVPVDLAAPALP